MENRNNWSQDLKTGLLKSQIKTASKLKKYLSFLNINILLQRLCRKLCVKTHNYVLLLKVDVNVNLIGDLGEPVPFHMLTIMYICLLKCKEVCECHKIRKEKISMHLWKNWIDITNYIWHLPYQILLRPSNIFGEN